MMQFQVFLSLWRVTSCSCIDKIHEVAKTSLKTKEIFFIKVMTRQRPPKMAFKHAPTCLHHNVGRFAKLLPNVYAKKEGAVFIVAVVLLLSWRCCVSL